MNQTATTIRPMTQRIRNLVLAGAAALAIAIMPVAHAYAAPAQPKLCVAYDYDGVVYFFLPGERAIVNFQKVFCGSDGEWHPDYSSIAVPTPTPSRLSTVRGPQGATLAR
jgi:hypothetical protein